MLDGSALALHNLRICSSNLNYSCLVSFFVYSTPQSSPHSVISTERRGLLPAPTATFSILRTTSIDAGSKTWPNTTCLLSSQSHLLQVMKNWQPLELAPLLAMDSKPGLSCFKTKFSSGNRSPKILRLPVPSPFTKSPPPC